MPLEFAHAKAPMSTDLPIVVLTTFTFSHSSTFCVFVSGNCGGIITILSVTRECASAEGQWKSYLTRVRSKPVNNDIIVIPDPLATDGQYRRFYHQDIADCEDSELLDELWALRPHLWGLPADHWLRERIAKLEVELIKRRRNTTSYELIERPKPKRAEGVEL